VGKNRQFRVGFQEEGHGQERNLKMEKVTNMKRKKYTITDKKASPRKGREV